MKLARIRLQPNMRDAVNVQWSSTTVRFALHLYAPQLLCLPIAPSEYAVVPERVADKFARHLREVHDANVTCIEPVLDTDTTPPEQGLNWGLPEDIARQLDDLAVRVAFRALHRDMFATSFDALAITLPPRELVASVLATLASTDPLVEKYFLTRTNFQIAATTSGRTSVQNSGMPEA